MNITAKVTSADLYEGLEKAMFERLESIDETLAETAEVVHQEAKNTTTFKDKTGNLRKSIKKRKSKFKDGGYIVFANAPHAHLVEFGHATPSGTRVGPKPFMRKSLEKGLVFLRGKVSNG